MPYGGSVDLTEGQAPDMSKLSAHDHEILEFLGRQGSCTPDAIARGCDLTRNWAVAYADRLARRGLARITTETGTVCYALTDRGRQVLHPEHGYTPTDAKGKPNIAARRWAGFYTARAAEEWYQAAVAAGPCAEHGLYACTGCSEEDSSASASGTPVADALAKLDAAEEREWDRPEDVTAALRALAEAVRASLAAFSEGDVRALASPPELAYSGTSRRGDIYATAEDFAAYLAAVMQADNSLDDYSGRAEGGTLVVLAHDFPVFRAEFRCCVEGCAEHEASGGAS